MFNEKIKSQYIAEKVQDDYMKINALKNKFSLSESYEEKLGYDLYDFSVTDIVNLYKRMMLSSLESLLVINNTYALYTDWALCRNLVEDSQNHFREIDNVILRSCLSKIDEDDMFITRQQLLNTIKSFYNTADKFIMLALFEGIGGTSYCDFHYLTMDCFDGLNVTLKGSGRNLTISNELYKLAEESSETFDHYSRTTGDPCHNNFDETDMRVVKRAGNARGVDTPQKTNRNIVNLLTNIKRNEDTSIYTAHNLNECGRIDMIQRLMRQDDADNIEATIIKHREEIEYRYGRLLSIPRFLLKYEKYIKGDA